MSESLIVIGCMYVCVYESVPIMWSKFGKLRAQIASDPDRSLSLPFSLYNIVMIQVFSVDGLFYIL